MFGLGPAEIVLVLIIALIVFGPRRLPEIGEALGKSIREFRDASSEITREFSREIEATERAARLEQPADKREKLADKQEEPSDKREKVADKQEEPSDKHEKAANKQEEPSDKREETAEEQEKPADESE